MAKKKIVYSKHAIERMAKRIVSSEDVQKTIDHPGVKLPLASDNTQEFRRKVDGKEHFVVIEHKKKEVIVITTGWSL
jgi:hypothetical protein